MKGRGMPRKYTTRKTPGKLPLNALPSSGQANISPGISPQTVMFFSSKENKTPVNIGVSIFTGVFFLHEPRIYGENPFSPHMHSSCAFSCVKSWREGRHPWHQSTRGGLFRRRHYCRQRSRLASSIAARRAAESFRCAALKATQHFAAANLATAFCSRILIRRCFLLMNPPP